MRMLDSERPKCFDGDCIHNNNDQCWRDGGMVCEWQIKRKIMNNADRIRSMSDEELAGLLYETETQYLPIGLHVENDWLDWLKQEVE